MNTVKELKPATKMTANIEDSLSPVQVDSIRQVQATLAIEGLSVDDKSLSVMKKIAHGDMTYEEAIADLKMSTRLL